MQSQQKPERPSKKRYLIAYGKFMGAKQTEYSASENMKKIGATEVLPTVWLLESDQGTESLREKLFERVMEKRGEILLAEVGEYFEAQSLPAAARAFPPGPQGTPRRP